MLQEKGISSTLSTCAWRGQVRRCRCRAFASIPNVGIHLSYTGSSSPSRLSSFTATAALAGPSRASSSPSIPRWPQTRRSSYSNPSSSSSPSSSAHCTPQSDSSSTHSGSLASGLTSLRKPQPDYNTLLADPDRTAQNASQRRVRLPHGEQHVERMSQVRTTLKELVKRTGEIKVRQKALGAEITRDLKSQTLRDQAKQLKGQISTHQLELDGLEAELLELGLALPNWSHPASPLGPEVNALEVLRFGPEPIGVDKARDHLDLCTTWALVDNDASAHTSGSSWPFLIGFLAQLEQALINHALSIAIARGFTPVITPDVVRADIAWRCGFQPRDPAAGAATQIYQLSTDPGTPEMCLAGTAEIPLGGLFAGKTFRVGELPAKVVGVGRSYRAEAGATGTDTRGLYRVHQFTKVEMFIVSEEDQSEGCFEELGTVQREIMELLRIPVRVLEMPTEELGASAARKWDMEAWMPGRGKWGEITSTSNCTDYQSRRLHIRHKPRVVPPGATNVHQEAQEANIAQAGAGARETTTRARTDKDKPQTTRFAHTLNGTAAAIPRLIIALMENGARFNDEGRVEGIDLPECLRRFWIGANDIGTGKIKGRVRWV